MVCKLGHTCEESTHIVTQHCSSVLFLTTKLCLAIKIIKQRYGSKQPVCAQEHNISLAWPIWKLKWLSLIYLTIKVMFVGPHQKHKMGMMNKQKLCKTEMCQYW